MASFVFRNLYYDPGMQKFVIKFTFDGFLVNKLKATIPAGKRKYDDSPGKKEWHVDLSAAKYVYEFAASCKDQPFNVMDSAKRILEQFAPKEYKEVELPNLSVKLPLKRDPFPFQGKGIEYNMRHRFVMIGDDMGLGKSFQAQASAVGVIEEEFKKRGKKLRTLVICPAHLKQNWIDEFEKNTNLKAVIMNEEIAKRPGAVMTSGYVDAVVVNYQSLVKYFTTSLIRDKEQKVTGVIMNGFEQYFDIVIVDEGHECNNPDSQRYMVVDRIMDKLDMQMRLILTGTPIKNSMAELRDELQLIRVLHLFGGYNAFTNKYCTGWESKEKGEKQNLANELKSILDNNCYYRREKHQVLTELPDKTRNLYKVDITTWEEYTKADQSFRKYLEENRRLSPDKVSSAMRAEVLVQIGHLCKISAMGKIKDITNFMNDLRAQDQKLVLFAHHNDVIDAFMEKNPDFLQIRGGMTSTEKDLSVKAFQNEKNKLGVICSIEAASTGLTLTAADKVAGIELPWNAAKWDQCAARVHRIGQKNAVNEYVFIGQNTYDEQRYELIEYKRNLGGQMLAIEDPTETTFFDGLWKSLFKAGV